MYTSLRNNITKETYPKPVPDPHISCSLLLLFLAVRQLKVILSASLKDAIEHATLGVSKGVEGIARVPWYSANVSLICCMNSGSLKDRSFGSFESMLLKKPSVAKVRARLTLA